MERAQQPPKVHELKCVQPYFDDIVSGRKTFEVRHDGRGFEVGHHLRLREWPPDQEAPPGGGPPPGDYTGREVTVEVTYLLKGPPFLPKGVVVMGIRLLPKPIVGVGKHVLTNHGLDTTNENRRLRALLEFLLKREDTTALLVEAAWHPSGFNITFCCPNGPDVEERLAKETIGKMDGFEAGYAYLARAAEEVLDPETKERWAERAQELIEAARRGQGR